MASIIISINKSDDDEDDIVGQDVNVQQHRVINDDILEEDERESITSVKMTTWSRAPSTLQPPNSEVVSRKPSFLYRGPLRAIGNIKLKLDRLVNQSQRDA